MMRVIATKSALREFRRGLSGKIGLVPTMGYLHAGHMALVDLAQAECDQVLVTIFINPTQFAANEDLSAYPRDLARDLAMLEQAGVTGVFTPSPEEIYGTGYQTYITVEQASRGGEGDVRPGHFRGVATIVAKLLNLAQADQAYFGQKDAQQVVVIRRMVADLDMPTRVVVGPTVREADGLALSSRNVYLTPEERRRAPVLWQALNAGARVYEQGQRHPERLRASVLDVLAQEPLAQVDYIGLNLASSLAEVTAPAEAPLLLSVAARFGRPRLLDNMLLPPHLNTRDGATASLGVTE